MMFAPALARAVAQGRKTQTRRAVRIGRLGVMLPCPYHPGQIITVQPGHGQTGIGQAQVTDVRREPLGDITHQDVQAEGFKTRAAFLLHYAAVNHHELPAAQRDLLERLGLVEFHEAPVAAAHPGLTSRALQARAPALHHRGLIRRAPHGWTVTDAGADVLHGDATPLLNLTQQVWVIELRPTTDRARKRLLTPAARPRGSELGYTTRRGEALPEEPEAVDARDLRPEWTERAQRRHAKVRADDERRRLARAAGERARQLALRSSPEQAQRILDQLDELERGQGDAA